MQHQGIQLYIAWVNLGSTNIYWKTVIDKEQKPGLVLVPFFDIKYTFCTCYPLVSIRLWLLSCYNQSSFSSFLYIKKGVECYWLVLSLRECVSLLNTCLFLILSLLVQKSIRYHPEIELASWNHWWLKYWYILSKRRVYFGKSVVHWVISGLKQGNIL